MNKPLCWNVVLHILVFFELYYLGSLLGGTHQGLQVNLEII